MQKHFIGKRPLLELRDTKIIQTDTSLPLGPEIIHQSVCPSWMTKVLSPRNLGFRLPNESTDASTWVPHDDLRSNWLHNTQRQEMIDLGPNSHRLISNLAQWHPSGLFEMSLLLSQSLAHGATRSFPSRDTFSRMAYKRSKVEADER